jgi:hypothetical protein
MGTKNKDNNEKKTRNKPPKNANGNNDRTATQTKPGHSRTKRGLQSYENRGIKTDVQHNLTNVHSTSSNHELISRIMFKKLLQFPK